MKIRTSHKNWNDKDYWWAWDEDSYDGPGSPLGSGDTMEEAIADLEESMNPTSIAVVGPEKIRKVKNAL